MAIPLEIEGIIRKNGTRSIVEITENTSGRVGAQLEDLEEGQPVRLILWDARPEHDRSNIERITEVQQLPREVVVAGLRTQGAIAEGREFMQALLARSEGDR